MLDSEHLWKPRDCFYFLNALERYKGYHSGENEQTYCHAVLGVTLKREMGKVLVAIHQQSRKNSEYCLGSRTLKGGMIFTVREMG